jgi:hypothetical protein
MKICTPSGSTVSESLKWSQRMYNESDVDYEKRQNFNDLNVKDFGN